MKEGSDSLSEGGVGSLTKIMAEEDVSVRRVPKHGGPVTGNHSWLLRGWECSMGQLGHSALFFFACPRYLLLLLLANEEG